MIQVICEEKEIDYSQGLTKVENLTKSSPPADFRCDVCKKLVSELKPFGCPGDPLVNDHTGELVVERWRPFVLLNQKAANAWVHALIQAGDNLLSWFVERYGEEDGNELYGLAQDMDGSGSWECRDCIVLEDEEYFEKKRQIREKSLFRVYYQGPMMVLRHDHESLYMAILKTERRLEELWLAIREGENRFDQFREVLREWQDLYFKAIELYEGTKYARKP